MYKDTLHVVNLPGFHLLVGFAWFVFSFIVIVFAINHWYLVYLERIYLAMSMLVVDLEYEENILHLF